MGEELFYPGKDDIQKYRHKNVIYMTTTGYSYASCYSIYTVVTYTRILNTTSFWGPQFQLSPLNMVQYCTLQCIVLYTALYT